MTPTYKVIISILLSIIIINAFGQDTSNLSKKIKGKWDRDHSKNMLLKVDGKFEPNYPIHDYEIFFTHLLLRNRKARLQKIDRADVSGFWRVEGLQIIFIIKKGHYNYTGKTTGVKNEEYISYNIVSVDENTLILSKAETIGSGQKIEAIYYYVKSKP